jgi:hypothetical protein
MNQKNVTQKGRYHQPAFAAIRALKNIASFTAEKDEA